MVGMFLVGFICLGGLQIWWLEPILVSMTAGTLFWSSMGLTAGTDNAALTYLGAQVKGLPGSSQNALLAGSLVGGGTTFIANAPNPVANGFLHRHFSDQSINQFRLLKWSLMFTGIAAICFWLLCEM